MKRYAVTAVGPKRTVIADFFKSFHENGCLIGDSLLTSFGDGFAVAVEVIGKNKKDISSAIKSLKGKLFSVSSMPINEGSVPVCNMMITLHGPGSSEIAYRLARLLYDTDAEIIEMEAKSLKRGGLFIMAVQAYCPKVSNLKKVRSQVVALAKKFSLKSDVVPIKPEDIL